jgi:hypothetical protein
MPNTYISSVSLVTSGYFPQIIKLSYNTFLFVAKQKSFANDSLQIFSDFAFVLFRSVYSFFSTSSLFGSLVQAIVIIHVYTLLPTLAKSFEFLVFANMA